LKLPKAYSDLMRKTPSLGDPQFGKTHDAMRDLISLADAIITEIEPEARKSGTIDKIREWKKKKKHLDSRLQK